MVILDPTAFRAPPSIPAHECALAIITRPNLALHFVGNVPRFLIPILLAGLNPASLLALLRPVNLIEYDRAALEEIAPHVIAFAEAEGLPAHGEAIRARFEEN